MRRYSIGGLFFIGRVALLIVPFVFASEGWWVPRHPGCDNCPWSDFPGFWLWLVLLIVQPLVSSAMLALEALRENRT